MNVMRSGDWAAHHLLLAAHVQDKDRPRAIKKLAELLYRHGTYRLTGKTAGMPGGHPSRQKACHSIVPETKKIANYWSNILRIRD